MGRLDGTVALISGAARGSGAAAARLFVEEGARVAIADLLDAEGEALAKELGDAAMFVRLDVTDLAQWEAAVAAVEERFGALNVLVNNAGILTFGSIEEMPIEQYMRVIDVNQHGVFYGMRAAAPAMRRAGGGSIVNVSSVEGQRGGAFLAAYGASKFAVRGMTKAAAIELGPAGIRVNSIHPGTVDTPMLRAQGLEGVDLDKLFGSVPLGRAGRPDDIARMMLFLASDDSSYCTGAEFVVDGGVTQYIGWFSKPVRAKH